MPSETYVQVWIALSRKVYLRIHKCKHILKLFQSRPLFPVPCTTNFPFTHMCLEPRSGVILTRHEFP